MRSNLPRLLVLLSVLLFAITHAVAVILYPGGTVFDAHTAGHSFWLNYLCDLTGAKALNGEPSPAAPFGVASMLVLSLGLAAFFWLISTQLRMARREASLTRWLGLIAVPGIWFATLAPPETRGEPLHAVAVLSGAIPGIAATVLAFQASFRNRHRHPIIGWSGAATLVTAATDTALYILALASALATPKALPAVQKLALLSLLTWMLSTALQSSDTQAASSAPALRTLRGSKAG